MRVLRIAAACAVLLALAVPAGAADVSLAWDASVSPDVVGYKIYVGQSSRTYGTPIVLGNITSYTVTGLGPGTWYFAATAYDGNGNESDFSNEVSQVIAVVTSCDVNGDGKISILDVQTMAAMLAKGQPLDLKFDLNHDGKVNVLDLQALADVIVKGGACP